MRFRTLLILLFCLLAAGVAGLYVLGRFHFLAAQTAYDHQEFDQARVELEKCLKVWPRSYRAHLLAARTARRLHDDDQAGQHLAACKYLEGETDAARLESVLIQVQHGRLGGAEEKLNQLIAENSPDTPLVLEALAEGYFKSFQAPKALLALQHLLQRQPANHFAYFFRGKVWQFLNQEEFALSDYERAVELKPQSDETRLRFADMLRQVGRIREAEAQFRSLQKRQPDNLTIAIGLARCHHDLAELNQAQQLLDTVLTVHPDHVPALIERGRVAIRQGELEAAESWLRKAVQLAPFDRDAHLVLHACLDAEHKREEADKILVIVKKLETDNSRLETLMARVQETPHEPSLYTEIGILFLQGGRAEEGLRLLQKAIQQDPGNVRARDALVEYERRANAAHGAGSASR